MKVFLLFCISPLHHHDRPVHLRAAKVGCESETVQSVLCIAAQSLLDSKLLESTDVSNMFTSVFPSLAPDLEFRARNHTLRG